MGNHAPRRATPAELVAFLGSCLPELPESATEADQRLSDIRVIFEGLERYGVDGDSLIRYGMSTVIAVSLVVSLLTEPRGSTRYLVSTERWREVLQVPHALLPDESEDEEQDWEAVQGQYHRIRPTVLRWIESAPMSEVLTLQAPTAEKLAEYEIGPSPADEVKAGYEWLAQRSTQADVSRWSNSALFMEFRWRQRGAGGAFPAEALIDPGPDAEELNYEIAKRAVDAPDGEPDQYDPLIWQLQDQAMAYLRQFRHMEASALFEFYHRLHPDSREAMNNLAFCRMPVDPESALHYLERAEKAGYAPLAINVYNQCCCLVQLGREGEALEKAEYFWQRQRDEAKVGGYLWREVTDGWEFYSEPDVALALTKLARRVAEGLGRTDRASRWSARADEITSSWVLPDQDAAPGAA